MAVAVEHKTRIKFREPLPPQLEHHLIHKLGFSFSFRKYNDFVIFEKPERFVFGTTPKVVVEDLKPKPVAKLSEYLTANDIIELGRKCQAIKAMFFDTVANAAMIRFRVQEMARPLNKDQKDWCDGWIERNVDEI